jgi:uncharacterized membrane protein YjjP (DUF1212 family)
MSLNETLARRMSFVVEIARRLHQYGTSAARLEQAIGSISARLGLTCNVWSSPTAIILSFADAAGGIDALADVTQVIRLSPGSDDLRNLSEVNEIADRVTEGELDISEGYRLLRLIGDHRGVRGRILETISYGIASATIAAILHSSWVDLVAAFFIGLTVGALAALTERSPRWRLSLEAISGLLATMLATLICVYVTPLSLKAVVLSSLIVLLPGLTLTTAVRELSTEHLVSGVARLAGAMATLIKLAFGTVVANQLCIFLNWVPPSEILTPIPAWAEWIALVCGCYAFAVLFRSARRDFPLVMAAVALGYLISYSAGRVSGPQIGVFFGGLCMGALSNFYALVTKRPGAIVRVPGIILLVPGSVGFLTISLIAQHDVFVGLNTAASLVALLVCLVAGLLFADLVFPPRRVL